MDLDHERLALQHLENALTWPPEERDQRLLEALAHNPALLTDVRELLRTAQSINDALPTSTPIAAPAMDAPPPDNIGPYRLTQLLGRGGMGSVYRAERADGAFERVVAIKLMRRTRLPELVAAQFARERHILAGLQHRNIAQLFDGGVTAEGHSYFVMELVTGRAITQFATEKELSLEATLQLYLQVCAAVQFAHARLVVHADIKPSNIIVTDDGIAKLLDFGVARVLADAEDGEGPRQPVALTPGYASPARQRGESPGTADDVYSLGVLLHALLSRFAAVPDDLRAICERARAQEADGRYASVETLQADIQRWLGSLPVQAYLGNWRYAAGKFFVRHRLAVAASGAALLLLAGAMMALALLYTRAEHARASAEERFADLHSLSRFVLFDVYDRLESTPRALALRRDLADAGQHYLDRLARDPDASSDVRLDVIEGLRRLAQVQANPGAPSVASAQVARRNLDRAEALASVLPSDAANRGERALALARIALARARLDGALDENFEAAHRSLDRATALLDEARQAAPANAKAAQANAVVAGLQSEVDAERADTLLWQGRYTQSIEVARAALSRLDAMPVDASIPRSPKMESAAVLSRVRLLDIYAEDHYYTEDFPTAEKAYREELELVARSHAALPDDLAVTRRFMRAEWALAETLLETNKAAEAERLLAEAVSIAETLRLFEPRDRDLERTAVVILTAHARSLSALKRFREALPLLERCVGMRRHLWDESPADWGFARDYAMGLASLADARAAAHQTAAACSAYAETLATLDRIRAAGRLAQLDEDHVTRLAREAQARYCHK
jgi:eukaryotic-like serine/threonine-protein kinase